MKRSVNRSAKPRRGIALIMVMGVGLVVLALGMAMLTTSGGILQSTVDTKQRIRSRYAAEAMIAIAIAQAVEKANQFFGAALQVDETPMGSLGTGNGEKGQAKVKNRVDPSSRLSQELINSGRLKGMMGLKIPLLIEAVGVAPGGAKSKIDADVRLYQVPIFQFGVFYEGPLEINPGGDMFVFGPVHTNSNALFRAATNLTMQGPVTVSGTLYHWFRSSGVIRYYLTPDTSAYLQPSITTTIAAMTSSTQPVAVAGVRNVDQGCEKLILPIGGATPRNLVTPRDSADPDALRFQKFDWKIICNAGACPSNRFVFGKDARPSWITGPRAFWDRREDRWVRVWDFDVAALAASGNRDSIFYLADTTLVPVDKGQKKAFLLNAFRIVNATNLPRNMSIASANPVYILGNFNLANPSGSCRPADYSGTVPDSLKYCNAQIASDAVTLLSPNWPNRSRKAAGLNGSLEQPWDSLPHWTDYVSRTGSGSTWDSTFATEPISSPSGDYTSGTVRINAAILTGNKPSNPAVLPPNNYSETTFENGYEGGWHNTIRFLENWSGATVVFKGSFVCMWKASARGLDTTAATVSIRGGHYNNPVRVWGFDPRFRNLNNMPPGTPFLATAIFTNWLEKR